MPTQHKPSPPHKPNTAVVAKPILLDTKLPRWQLAVFLTFFVFVGSVLVYFVLAATETELFTVEAEALSAPPTAKVVDDPLASGTKALHLPDSGAAVETKSVATGIALSRLAIRARGVQCKGAPYMTVYVDDKRIDSLAVTSTTWADYSLVTNIPAGSHRVAVRFANAGYGTGCKRSILLDKLTFFGLSSVPNSPPGDLQP